LCGRRHEFKYEVLEVTFIHRDTELTYLGMDKVLTRDTKSTAHPPPVLSHSSLQIFISAAKATTDIRILFFTHSSNVSWILPGSQVVSEPNMIRISREEWVGRWLQMVKQRQYMFVHNLPHCTTRHFNSILQARFAYRFQFMSISYSPEYILRITWRLC